MPKANAPLLLPPTTHTFTTTLLLPGLSLEWLPECRVCLSSLAAGLPLPCPGRRAGTRDVAPPRSLYGSAGKRGAGGDNLDRGPRAGRPHSVYPGVYRVKESVWAVMVPTSRGARVSTGVQLESPLLAAEFYSQLLHGLFHGREDLLH